MRTPHHLAARTLALLLCLWASVLWAAEGLRVRIDKKTLGVGEAATLSVRVPAGSAGAPRLPELPDSIEVQGGGRRSVTNIINFQIESYLEYTWLLIPSEPGSYEIGPITARIGSETEASQPFTLTVRADGEVASGRDAFVDVQVTPSTAWPGQTLNYKTRFYYDVQVTDFNYDAPSFEGFVEEPTQDGLKKQSLEEVNGRSYVVEEVTHVITPTRAGTLRIDPAGVVVEVLTRRSATRAADPFGAFFGQAPGTTAQRKYYGEPREVIVKPFPQGAPEGFAGLVGEFSIRAGLSAASIPRGESTTLTVVVEGRGNVRDIPEPQLSMDGVKTYPDQPQLSVEIDPASATIVGKKVFKIALIPQQEGGVTLPPLAVHFLDPASGRYVTRTTEALVLNVSAGAGPAPAAPTAATSAAPERQEIAALGSDILPLKKVGAPPPLGALTPTSPQMAGLALAPCLGFGVVVLVRRRRDRELSDPGLVRRKRALSRSSVALKEAAGAPSPREQLRGIDRALRSYLVDRLGLEGGALTPGEVDAVLTRAGVSPALRGEVGGLLSTLEHAQYRPEGGGGAPAELAQRASALLTRLDKELA